MISTFISIIIPGFNEEARIQKTLTSLHAFCCNRFQNFEILFIDDGSNDKTRSIVNKIAQKKYQIRSLGYAKNLGKGYAIRYGLTHAKGKYVFFTDADLPYDPEFFCQAINTFENKNCDIVVGNRQMSNSKTEAGLSRKRQLTSYVFSKIVQNILKISINDTQCGVKGFSKTCSQNIVNESSINGYAFDVEIFVLARKNNWDLVSLPVILINNQLSKIRLGFDPFNIIWDILKLACRYR